ncbi:hypothetical protein F5Y03DRAFT_407327 [Xylaria venustula]|nr:hypothetical protein F5Y03DRAFT_407327 [Xylaria venustula]
MRRVSTPDYVLPDRSIDAGVTSDRDILSEINNDNDSDLRSVLADYAIFTNYDHEPLPLYEGDKLPIYTPPSSLPSSPARPLYYSRFTEHFDISMSTLEAHRYEESSTYTTNEGCEPKIHRRQTLLSKLCLCLKAKMEKLKKELLCGKKT